MGSKDLRLFGSTDATDTYVKQAVDLLAIKTFTLTLLRDTSLGVKEGQMIKCLNADGDYLQVRRVSSAIHMSRMKTRQNKAARHRFVTLTQRGDTHTATSG